jgi:hypothetical protein
MERIKFPQVFKVKENQSDSDLLKLPFTISLTDSLASLGTLEEQLQENNNEAVEPQGER